MVYVRFPLFEALVHTPREYECAVPPRASCSWKAIPAPPDFMEAQLVSGAHLIATRIRHATQISPNGSLTHTPIHKPVDLYRIPPGGKLSIGNHIIYGTVYANTPVMDVADVKFDLAGDRADELARKKSLLLTATLKTATSAFGKDVEILVAHSKPLGGGGVIGYFMNPFNSAVLLLTLTTGLSLLSALAFWQHCRGKVPPSHSEPVC